MIRHSLLLMYRNFKRFKSTFFINLIGLSSGLACALLIFLWVSDELSVDGFHENDSRLFQVMTNHDNAEGVTTMEAGPGLLAETLAEEVPEVKYAVSSSIIPDKFVVSDDNHHINASGQFVSKDFFNVFSYPLLHGNREQVLAGKSAIVISEELAMKLFGTTNAVGRTIKWQILHFGKPVVVTGVFKNVPANSSKQFDFLASFEEFKDMLGDGLHWDNHNAETYLLLAEGVDPGQVNQKITGFIKQKLPTSNVSLLIRPYSDRYLYGTYENGVQAGGRIAYVRLFSIVAVFILLIACINFMNLSTAKASRRIKEVGIKKSLGASRASLAMHYLGESLLMAFAALILALTIVELSIGPFNAITGKQLALSFAPEFVLGAFGIACITGLLAGSYPALYLSGFRPAEVLRGRLEGLGGEMWARKGLVVFQFTLSVILIVAVLVVYKQIEYVQTKNLGYNKDNIVYFSAEGKVQQNLEPFLSEVRQIPGITNASSGGSIIGDIGSTIGLTWPGKNPDDDVAFQTVAVNYGMIETLGISIKSGRAFSKEFATDTAKIVFNETAIATMGMQDPVGKTVNLWGEDKKIIGVVKDFHFQSLHEQVKPMFFRLEPKQAMKVMARMEAGRENEAIAQLQELHEKYNPGFELDYKFLNEDYESLYAAEQRVAVLSKYFAGLAILISCLGLFGLATFTAERRLKEIGVRKVLGASEFSIAYLLSVDFSKLVLISILIALPASYLLVTYWLQNFAYRIELKLWYFVGAGLLALFIAWFTVGMQAVKAAKVNPTQCLSDE
ncbi:ABC transporter permease [Pontibacter anaerobius]|uniref:ABC transporter permease n=1 Tax=Pontibacter anaerobius TaxID=2993940 RepID=A0ABT3REZ0_9BACT|nr:ABC transporter permease [Pontibacter anaerobius]MCX2740411.1 ABC transporter permease [Pontibacter anaerobius]